MHGGPQESDRRPGTENLAAIVGLTLALERFVPEPVFKPARLKPLTDDLWDWLATLPGVRPRGSRSLRLSNTVAFTVAGADSLALLANLDLEGICASSGAACSSGALVPSHVVEALNPPGHPTGAFVRFSLGPYATADQVQHVKKVLMDVLARCRAGEQTWV
jgi:cysteine desulfurase